MNLIVMLTQNDVTVSNAKEVFLSCADLPVAHWGFKNVGLDTKQMKELVGIIKAAGKVAYLEVVTYDEPECLKAAQLAIECDFDYLMGTIYYDSVAEVLKNSTTRYSPFCGHVWGSPSILGDTIEKIIENAKELEAKGVDGIDILAYRFKGDADHLLQKYFAEVNVPTTIAGSIASFERIDFIKQLNPWGFTMGSALFEKKFVKDGSFRDNLAAVNGYLQK